MIALASAGVTAQAEKAAAYKHPLTDMPPAHDGVETAFWFAKSPKTQFPAGQPGEVTVGFYNGAAEPLNISAIMGSLNSPFDFSFHVQNFTYQMYDAKLQPGGEVSLDYTFIPYGQLQPREFALALTVFYHTDKQLYSSTFFNGTVDITEPESLIDSQLIFLYLMALGAVGAIGYTIYSYLMSAGIVKKPKRGPKKADVAKGEADASEWLKGTAYDQFQKAKAKKTTSIKKE